ncbi:copper amine oxidase [Pseudoflavonifractor sp. AF19-9AC]|uniref:cell wall hydrolase n=1 Tax=Pseudoflavonifractor sp. AF19-9AC TaxID=2292244 RepID=UPI000E4FB8DB|nr:cell wall hydrolase [Pseudoflavonifractor sp. AF19-9AC]RHR08905.1 copper amine oxidase [Pseudoflavonifractor sp. AF19-9AC]
MIRKLFSTLLCAFALLLLMGAGTAPQQPVTVLAEEESAAEINGALETENQSVYKVSSQAIPAAAAASPIELAESTESRLLVDGIAAPAEVEMTQKDGVTYVALANMALCLDETAAVNWNAESQVLTVTTSKLSLTAKVGQLYLEANGRYLYLPEGVQMVNGKVVVPLWAVTEAFGAKPGWESSTGIVTVTRGSGAIQSGDSYYDQNDLFWLARIIYAESGNQPLEGQMAVGIVVMNRVESPIYPNTVEGVLAQKNQFSTYQSGRLANRTPNASSVIAAKLVLDGGVVSEVKDALYFDSSSNSWASRNKECVAVIGNHKFYA